MNTTPTQIEALTVYGIDYKLNGDIIASEEFDTEAARDARLAVVEQDTTIHPQASHITPYTRQKTLQVVCVWQGHAPHRRAEKMVYRQQFV